GLLVGWSEHGDRPEFDLVTGISAGALIAPFAFLGRAYDSQLAGLFTSYGADQIYESNVLSGIFGGKALANSKPLAKLIEKHVDGGTTREVFFTIADFQFNDIDKAIGRKVQRRLWIIRNGKIEPEYKAMPETTLAIAQRSLETLTKSRGIGDLARMYARARADKIDYNLAAIPLDFNVKHPMPFD